MYTNKITDTNRRSGFCLEGGKVKLKILGQYLRFLLPFAKDFFRLPWPDPNKTWPHLRLPLILVVESQGICPIFGNLMAHVYCLGPNTRAHKRFKPRSKLVHSSAG